MAIKDIIPARWRRTNDLEVRNSNYSDPFLSLQREMNRVFDSFFDNWDSSREMASFSPTLDVSENDKEFSVNIELPGLDEKDIDVSCTDDSLTISGMKKNERERRW
jgi:HSP20 family protein